MIRRLLETAIILGIGLVIASVIGFLQNQSPAGDDAYYYVGMTKTLASDFPNLSWDPRLFAGYVPSIGLSWVTLSFPSLLVGAGLDAISSFHLSFILAFFLFGFSVFYFARIVGSGTIFSISMVILGWSTTAYWNNAVWGGAYDRVFTIPFMFIALASTFRWASRPNDDRAHSWDYIMCLILWTLTYLGDIFISIAASIPGAIFLLFSAGTRNLTTGLKRVVIVFVPVAGLALWQLVPVILQAISVGPFRLQYTGTLDVASLVVPGAVFVSTLNYVYIPLLVGLITASLLVRPRIFSIERALLASLAVMGVYWVIMGWVPALWPYIPRLMATYNSIENLAWLLLLAFPVSFATLRRELASGRLLRLSVLGSWRFSIEGSRLMKTLAILVLLFVVSDAVVVLPGIHLVEWGRLADQLNTHLNSAIGPPSNDYRVSLQNRFLTSPFLYYQPSRFDTGGRVENLDPNPFYNNWYLTDVFYKNDLTLIAGAYSEDRPPTNMSSILESAYNYAGENFWLDWYGVDGVAFYPYAFGNTVGNYSARPSLFSTILANTTYSVNEVIVKPDTPSPILTVTNSSVVGFYSTSSNTQDEYHTLISMLSRLGLDSRYVIPIYLTSIQEVFSTPLNVLVTDSSTYSQQVQALQPLFDTSDIIDVSSSDGKSGSGPTFSPVGAHLLITVPISFSQLLNGQEPAAYFFANSTRLVPIQSVKPTASTYYPPTIIAPSLSSWMNTYRTPNAKGTLQTSGNSLTLNLTNNDPTTRSQYNIQSHLTSLIPLSNDLTVSFSIQTSANITLGTVFTQPTNCCPNFIANDSSISPGISHQLRIPFSSFAKWENSTSVFGITQDLTLAVNLPPGQPNAIVKLTNITITAPAYTESTLPTNLLLVDNGVLHYDSPVLGVGLYSSSNASTTILSPTSRLQESVITISSFSGGQPGQQYDHVITIGGNNSITPTIGLFSERPWSLVHEEWTNNQNMVASSIPQEFRGVVWKETYSPLWKFETESNGSTRSLSYYYAGPGMVYIPLSQPTSSIRASLESTTIQSIALFSTPFATIAVLALLRKRIPTFGRRIRNELTKTRED